MKHKSDNHAIRETMPDQKNNTIVYATTIAATLQSFARGQLRYLEEHGFNIIALSSPGAALQNLAQKEGIAAHGISMTRKLTPIRDIISFFKILKFLIITKPVAVNAGTLKAALLVLAAACLCRVPLRFFLAHGARLAHLHGLRYYVFKLILLAACRCSHKVICVGESVRSALVEHGVCKAEKTTVLHYGSANGIDYNYFNPDRFDENARLRIRNNLNINIDAMILLFVGRIVRDKGIIELEKAWSIIKERYQNAFLILAGREEEESPIPKDVMKRLNNDPRVRLTGHIEDTASLYAIAHMLILPTYREGFPYVPMEAASMSIPVVATRVTGCVDAVLDGTTGTLVSPKDVDSLVMAVERYIKNPDLALRHGRAGRERVIRFYRPEDVWRAVYDEYVDELSKKGLFADKSRQ